MAWLDNKPNGRKATHPPRQGVISSLRHLYEDEPVPGSPYRKGRPNPDAEPTTSARTSKKQRIVELHASGVTDVEQIADIVECRPSYVADVLQRAGRIEGYYDLYTHTSAPMNIYTQFFKGKLGFRDLATAEKSINVLERAYRMYQVRRDRAGQHHALSTALTLFDRARWSRKRREAAVFRDWLVAKLHESDLRQ